MFFQSFFTVFGKFLAERIKVIKMVSSDWIKNLLTASYTVLRQFTFVDAF